MSATDIQFPDASSLLPHQLEVIDDPARFKVLIWHRRARKTTTAINEIIKQAISKVGVYWHIFPTYAEAKDAVWRDPKMLFKILPPEIIEKKNEQELVVVLKNKSVIQLKGADDPDALRGAGPVGIVMDEFAKIKAEAWPTLEPILRANDGWAWFIGTPVGKNQLYDFYLRGQKEERGWKSWMLKASTSGIISQDQLEEARADAISEEFYNQEYECAFLEGVGQVFKGVRAIATATPQPPIREHLYIIGVDLAKHEDYTVITVFDRTNNQQVYQQRFNTIDWVVQKKEIITIAKHYNNAALVVDATGVGDPIYEDLAYAGLAVNGVKITEPIKRELIQKLSIWIQQKRFKILPLEETIFELENFAYKRGPTGKYRYEAPSGQHDDIVLSLALAVSALTLIFHEPTIKPKTLLQLDYERSVNNFQQYDVNNELDDWVNF